MLLADTTLYPKSNLMQNEKNFILALVITVCVIIFYPMFVKQFFPQYFPEQTQDQPQLSQEAPKARIPERQPAQPIIATTYSKKTSYELNNNKFSVVVNSPRGEIKSIKIAEIIDPITEAPTELMNTNDKTAGIFADKGLTDSAVLERVEEKPGTISFYYEQPSGLKIKKSIILDNQDYKILLELEIENTTPKEQIASYRFVAATGIKSVVGVEQRYCQQITFFRNKKIKKTGIANSKETTIAGDIQFSGFMLRYFSLLVAPLVTTDAVYSYDPKAGEGLAAAAMDIGVEKIKVASRKTIKMQHILYAGPNDEQEMSRLNLGLEQVRGKGVFVGLSDLLLLLLRLLHKIFHNYGAAVIGLAITVNLFLFPLTFKSLKAMKEMQALQPHIEKLRTEHKDNPQKLNKEIMELYRKHKVNPAGGCLPMLLQMPVFFSLYGVLMRAIELRGARFLWIKDLASPDAFMTFSGRVPLIGSTLNLLPLLMMAVSFVQQKITNPTTANDQQKAMGMMMPVLLGVIFYNFPSGLALYFLTNSLFSFFVQAKMTGLAEVKNS